MAHNEGSENDTNLAKKLFVYISFVSEGRQKWNEFRTFVILVSEVSAKAVG